MLILLLIIPASMLLVVRNLIWFPAHKLSPFPSVHFPTPRFVYRHDPEIIQFFVQGIKLIAQSKREKTTVVARAYIVQFMILSGLIAVYGWALSLPGVQRINGLGLTGGIDYKGLVCHLFVTYCIFPKNDLKSRFDPGYIYQQVRSQPRLEPEFRDRSLSFKQLVYKFATVYRMQLWRQPVFGFWQSSQFRSSEWSASGEFHLSLPRLRTDNQEPKCWRLETSL